jgi:delta24-sterol reductase
MKLKEVAMLAVMATILFWTTVLICIFVLPLTVSLGFAYFAVTFVLGSFSPSSIEDIALAKMTSISPLAKFATKHRSPLVMAFVLPMSVIFDTFFFLRTEFIVRSNSAPDLHEARVAKIQEQVRQWIADGSERPMATARPGWLGISPKYALYKEHVRKIKVDLYDVLELDEDAMTVRVEPCVSMGQLSHVLTAKGYTIPVLPEMDDLTVGGLICGCGVESSSHLYGLFQATCTRFEIVGADGELHCASADENPELFGAIPWSYGSLGFLVSATIRIIPSKKYVRLTYTPFDDAAAYCKYFEEESKKPLGEAHVFVEGLVYSKDRAVIMVGDMVDEVGSDAPLNCIGKFWKPWFFKHVEAMLTGMGGANDGAEVVEYVPLRDYYHRHTRSIFWEAQDIVPIGNHPLFRLLFGWMMPPKVSFLKLTQTEALHKMYKEQHVIQDMLVPVNKLQLSIEKFDEQYQLYPLWLCPMKLYDVPGFVQPKIEETMFVDIGAYGVPESARRGEFDGETSGKVVEAFVAEHKGFQMLYADSYLTRDEFRSMFDHTLLDKMRKQLGAEKAFPEPFAKVCHKVGSGNDATTGKAKKTN